MKKSFIALAVTAVVFASCKDDKPEVKENISVQEEEVLTDESGNLVDYTIPSPSEQFQIVAKLDGTKKPNAILSVDSLNNYTVNKKKAMVFGVYTSDLAYLTSYKENVKTLAYFGAIEKLGDDLGVSAIFSDEIKKAMDKNRSNSDSLFKMADQTYVNSMNKMVANDKGNELALMLIGGWIESMYLTLQTSKGFEKSPRINKYLASQKVVAENLMGLLLDYQDNAEVVAETENLSAILAIFDKMECSYSDSKMSTSDGKNVLKGGADCNLSKELFDELNEKVNNYRNEIITAN